jgi:hypothetical protein
MMCSPVGLPTAGMRLELTGPPPSRTQRAEDREGRSHGLHRLWQTPLPAGRTRIVNVLSRSSVLPLIVFCCFLETASLAQNDRAFQFDNYQSDEVFQSGPVAPKITDPVHRKYRSRIQDGVEKGWGVFRDGVEMKGPNFAGHMIAVRWGCGTGCAAMVFVDAQTGKVYNPPLPIGRFGDQRIGLPMFQGGIAEVEYHINSRLFKMKACPGEPSRLSLDDPCYSYDFRWDGDRWSLLRRQRLAAQEQ